MLSKAWLQVLPEAKGPMCHPVIALLDSFWYPPVNPHCSFSFSERFLSSIFLSISFLECGVGLG